MTSSRRRGWRRWLPLGVGLAVLAGVILWQASGFVIALVLEKQLRGGDWPDARVEGASLEFADVAFERIVLVPDGRLVAENVRARLGAGIERIAIGRLHAEIAVTADGKWVLPTGSASASGAPPLASLPPDGITLERADVRVTTPAGIAGLTMTDVVVARVEDLARLSGAYALGFAAPESPSISIAGLDDLAVDLTGRAMGEVRADGRAEIRVTIEAGALTAGDARAVGLGGDIAAALPPGGSPFVEIEAQAEAAEVAGVGLGAFAVDASWRDGAARFGVTTPEPDIADVSIDGRAVLADGTRAASVSGRVRLDAERAQGLVTFDAELESRSPTGASEPAAFSGRLRLDARDVVYSGVLTGGALDLSAEVAREGDELRVTMSEAQAQMTPAPALVPDGAERLASDALSVRLAPGSDGRPTLRWSFAERAAELSANLEARSGDARVTTALRATVGPSRAEPDGSAPSGSGLAVEAELSDLVARNLPWRDAVLGIDAFNGTIEHDADRWRIDGAGTLEATGAFGPVRVDGSAAEWSGTATGTPERIVVTAKRCVEWKAESIALGTVRVDGLSPLCIAPGEDGVLWSHETGTGSSAFAFSVAEQPLAASLATGDASYAFDGTSPRLVVSGTTNAAGVESLIARSSGGELMSSDAQIALTGVDGAVQLRDGALASAELRVARLESLAAPAPIVPVGLELTATRAGDALTFDAIASDDLGTFVLEAAGRHERGRASADVRLYPVRFITGATEIADLSPLVAEHVADASGVLELEGGVEWSGGELTAAGVLKIADFAAVVAGVPITGLSTETRFTSLVPPATAAEQTVTVARIDLGVPLEDGVAVFDLDAAGELAFGRIEFELAGGRLFAEPFTVDSADLEDIGFVLRAEDVELSDFLALSRIDGLSGSGVLTGRVPVRLTDGAIRLDDGVLAAQTDGVLRYTPEDLPDFLRGDDVRSQMLREVLTNFHYEELSLTVSGDSAEDGAQRLTLNARGANPDFLEGHPIELSFNFQGPLLGAVRSAVDLTDAAELEQLFEQQETNNEEEDSR